MTGPIDSSERRRQEIYKFIVENPGLGVNDLARELCDYTKSNHICAKGTLLQELNNLDEEGQIQKIKEGKQGFKVYPFIHEVTLDKRLAQSLEISLVRVNSIFRMAENIEKLNETPYSKDMEKMAMILFCIFDLSSIRFSAVMYNSLSKRKKINIQLYHDVLEKADKLTKKIVNYVVNEKRKISKEKQLELWNLVLQNHDRAVFRSCKNFASFFPPKFQRKNSEFMNKYNIYPMESIGSKNPKK